MRSVSSDPGRKQKLEGRRRRESRTSCVFPVSKNPFRSRERCSNHLQYMPLGFCMPACGLPERAKVSKPVSSSHSEGWVLMSKERQQVAGVGEPFRRENEHHF